MIGTAAPILADWYTHAQLNALFDSHGFPGDAPDGNKIEKCRLWLRHGNKELPDALTNFANSTPAPFIAGIKSARERIVARSDEDRDSFLRQRGFSKSETTKIIETVSREEGRPPESIFDFVQGITALARTKTHQDARLELEGKAKRLMERTI